MAGSTPVHRVLHSMPSLRKLIVVDSYAASRIREIQLDGHVHISGRNGRGKTTLIRLIPLFYGEQPSRIVRSAGSVVRSLREFMFSRSTSYVAFEYQNHDGIKLAILHFGADNSPQYHLADGPYAREIFVEDGKLVEGRHLNGRLKVLERNPSSALGVLQYRTVIQGSSERSTSPGMRPLIRRFALVHGRSRLAGIERISSGMFSKDITFAALKRMAASVACDEEDKQIVLALSRKELEGFLPDFKAYRAAMDLEPVFGSANSAYVQSNVARHLRALAAGKLRRLVIALGELLGTQRQRESDAEDAVAALRREQRDAVAGFDLEAETLNAKIARLNEDIARADAEEKEWAHRDIDALVEWVEQRPALETLAQQLKARQQDLLAAADSVSRKYQALFAAEGARRDQAQNDAERRLNATTGALNQEIATINGEREAALSLLAGTQDEETAVANDAWQEAVSTVSDIDRQLAVLVPDPELCGQAIKAEQARSEAELAWRQARDAEGQALLKLTQHEHALEQQQQLLAQLSQKHRQANERLAQVLLLESPDRGSLLHYLRTHCPDWHTDIAKVIREDLLLRNDLSPELAIDEDRRDTLYGLAISLARIDAGRAASEETLAAEIARAKAAESDAKAALDSAIKHRQNALRELDRARESQRDAIAATARTHGNAELQRQTAEAATARRDDELSERRRALTAARGEASSIATRRKSAIGELKEAHRRARTALDAAFATRVQGVEARRIAATQRHAEEVKRLDEAKAKAMSGLEKLRLSELSAAGVDTAALATLEDELKLAEQSARRARDAAPVVEQYQRWLLQIPPQRQRNEATLVATRAEFEALDLRRREALSRFAARIANQEEVLAQAQQTVKATRQRLQDAESAQQERLAGIETAIPDESTAVAVHWSLPEILSALDHANQQLRAQEALLRQQLGTLVRTFHRPEFAATKVGEYGANLPVDYWSEIALTLDIFADWYGTAHAQQREVLSGALRNGCGILKRFQGGLLSFQSSITGLSRELQGSLESGMVFEAIRSISLRLSALVEARPYWGALSRVLDAYDQWEEGGFADLPDQTLLEELQDFSRHLPEGALAENPETLMDLEIEVDDGTDLKRVRTEADLKQVSSNGLSYLVLCLIFVAFANRARRYQESAELWLTWALDEIGTIDEGNSKALLAMLNRNRIRLVSASPEAKESLRALFDHRYEVLQDFEIQRILGEREIPGKFPPTDARIFGEQAALEASDEH